MSEPAAEAAEETYVHAVVLFGGMGHSVTNPGDTWEWNGSVALSSTAKS